MLRKTAAANVTQVLEQDIMAKQRKHKVYGERHHHLIDVLALPRESISALGSVLKAFQLHQSRA